MALAETQDSERYRVTETAAPLSLKGHLAEVIFSLVKPHVYVPSGGMVAFYPELTPKDITLEEVARQWPQIPFSEKDNGVAERVSVKDIFLTITSCEEPFCFQDEYGNGWTVELSPENNFDRRFANTPQFYQRNKNDRDVGGNFRRVRGVKPDVLSQMLRHQKITLACEDTPIDLVVV